MIAIQLNAAVYFIDRVCSVGRYCKLNSYYKQRHLQKETGVKSWGWNNFIMMGFHSRLGME